MTSQQLNVDNISNNIANVNTTGYKRERLEFKSLLYQTMERATLDANGMGRPVNLQVGHGVRPIVSSRIFSNGSFDRTDNPSKVSLLLTEVTEILFIQKTEVLNLVLAMGKLLLLPRRDTLF